MTAADTQAGPDTWGDRWVDAFVPVRTPSDGVERLHVDPGCVTARVRDRSGRRLDVAVEVPTFDADQWQGIVEHLGGSLRHAADLVAGRVPVAIEEVAADAGLELFPADVTVRCECGDAPACSHAAGVHRAVGEALRGDPSLLLTLRGRDRTELLATLRARRAGADAEAVASRTRRESVPLEEIPVATFYEAPGTLADVRLQPEPPHEPAALLRRLGEPPGVDDTGHLERLVEIAADTAWKLAAGEGAQVADEELLLAELRARGMATGREVAGALGWPVERTREVLDRLYEDGTLLRMGSGEAARYRA